MAQKTMVEIGTLVDISPVIHQKAIFRLQEAKNVSRPDQRLPVEAVPAAHIQARFLEKPQTEWLEVLRARADAFRWRQL